MRVWKAAGGLSSPCAISAGSEGKPASYDARYPGTYNARRDNLAGFWREIVGRCHAILLATAFYEKPGATAQRRPGFSPRPGP